MYYKVLYAGKRSSRKVYTSELQHFVQASNIEVVTHRSWENARS